MAARKKKVVRKYKPRTKVARGRAHAKAKAAVIPRKPRRKVATRRKAPLKAQARKPVKFPRSLDNVNGVTKVNNGIMWVGVQAKVNTKLGRAQARKLLARAEDFIKHFDDM